MNLDELQLEHTTWLLTMYPNQPPIIPAAGVVEESGELLHAVLKLEQAKLWGDEPRYPEGILRVKMLDAIGDCAIYVCSLCNAQGWSFQGLYDGSPEYPPEGNLLSMCNTLVEDAAKVMSLRIRDASRYLSMLRTVGRAVNVDPEEAAVETWKEVKKRTRHLDCGTSKRT